MTRIEHSKTMRWTHTGPRRRFQRMKLYFSPLSCSLATRIALYEAGAPAEYVEVDAKTKRTAEGDYRDVHPLALVPALRTDDGGLVVENAAVLQYVADRFPRAALAPASGPARTRLQQWLCFIGTELHKVVFMPLLDKDAPQAVKDYALSKADRRLSWVASQLEGRETLLDSLSVADAYLFVVLNWSVVTPVDLQRWPAITTYLKRLHERPHFACAFAEERELYVREQARSK